MRTLWNPKLNTKFSIMHVEHREYRYQAHHPSCEINQPHLIKAGMGCRLFTKHESTIRHKKKKEKQQHASIYGSEKLTGVVAAGREHSRQHWPLALPSPMVWGGLLLWPVTQHSQPLALHTVVHGWRCNLAHQHFLNHLKNNFLFCSIFLFLRGTLWTASLLCAMGDKESSNQTVITVDSSPDYTPSMYSVEYETLLSIYCCRILLDTLSDY